MSEKNLTGQMNMFDYYGDNNEKSTNVVLTPGKLGNRKVKITEEKSTEEKKTVEMKSEEVKSKTELEPEELVEPAVIVESRIEQISVSDVVMKREIADSAGRVVKSVSYINYNKVKIITNYDEEKLYEFETAKEAVDFYVEKMQNLKKL